jgi:L-ascorbate metabolism protein UlaG (beta-lactamase superfamily)
MSPNSAALAAELLGLSVAVACHYEEADHPDVKAFLEDLPRHDTTGKRRGFALRPGETLVVDGSKVAVEQS